MCSTSNLWVNEEKGVQFNVIDSQFLFNSIKFEALLFLEFSFELSKESHIS